MARLSCDRPGWGAVRDPETGEHVSLSADVSAEVADRLADEYDAVSVVEDAAATCETVKSDGEVCGRELPCRWHSETEEE